MRRVFAATFSLLAAAPSVSFAACQDDVVAAFNKQRKSAAFRVEMAQPTAEGPVTVRVDYVPPNKMLQTVTGGNMPGEQQTLLDGDRAFAGTSGAFEELLPQYTQSIVAEVKTALGQAPENLGDFECLGKVAFEGKDLLAYRTKPAADAKTGEASLTRTVYVDPASGLPAFNVINPAKAGEPPVMKAVYSYPSGIVIEAPQGAPVQKTK